ncbi:MAG: hypothetical protein ABIS03_13340 [Gemmatimonadaceae bacterium]
MRLLKSVVLAVTVLTASSACTALDSIASGNRVTGTYSLYRVNGYSLPTTIYQEPGYRVEVLNAAFTLETDGTFSEAGIVRETYNGQSTTRSSSSYGYYDNYNGELTFDDNSGRRYYGNSDGNTLVIDDRGIQMTYRRN